MAEAACFEAYLGHSEGLADQQLQLPATAAAAGSTAVAGATAAAAAAAEHLQVDHPADSADGQPAATASQDSGFEAAWISFGHGLEAPKLLAAKQKQFAAVVAAVLAGPLRIALLGTMQDHVGWLLPAAVPEGQRQTALGPHHWGS